MAPLNEDDYGANDRDLYMEYEEYLIQDKCQTWDDIFFEIKVIANGKSLKSERYNKLKKKFHTFNDSKASARIVREVKARF